MSLLRQTLRPDKNVRGQGMGAVGFGSFAHVGRRVQATPPITEKGGLYLAVEIGELCQLACTHCVYMHEANDKVAQLPNPAVIKKVVDAIASGAVNPTWVSFSGKEPTLFPDELRTLARAVRSPERETVLMSNGLRGNLLLELAAEDLITCFDISLDGDIEGHELLRGPNTFERTMRSLNALLATDTTALVGVISTLTREVLPSGRTRSESIAALTHELLTRFGNDPRLSHTISLYYGPPGDTKCLDIETIATLCEQLREKNFHTRVLVSANYAHLWGRLAVRLGIEDIAMQYDAISGLAIVRCGSLDFILLMACSNEQHCVRVATQGETYLSCNHLELPPDQRKQFSLGNVQDMPLDEIVRQVMTHKHRLVQRAQYMDPHCALCTHLSTCGGGDVLSGLYFKGVAKDPQCDLLAAAG